MLRLRKTYLLYGTCPNNLSRNFEIIQAPQDRRLSVVYLIAETRENHFGRIDYREYNRGARNTLERP